uniref:SMB domain-containing protein n=1 Tax=Glossina brevipalpis TaxID=37001 RepID=A0A1A9WAI7_9MUSC
MYKSLIKPSIDLISLLTITLTLRQQLTATKKQPLATSSKSSSSPLTTPLPAPRRPTTKSARAPTTYQCQMLRQNLNEFIIKSNNNNNNNKNNNNSNKLRITNIFYNTYGYAVVLFTLLLLLVETPLNVHAGLCREAQLCCNGRDSSCVVQKAPINAIIEDLSDKPCYCDHACLKLGDCCVDFKDHCGGLADKLYCKATQYLLLLHFVKDPFAYFKYLDLSFRAFPQA